jgi:hypothetical protein
LCFARGKLPRRESRDLLELVEINRRIEGMRQERRVNGSSTCFGGEDEK